jgi:hypothetical protein
MDGVGGRRARCRGLAALLLLAAGCGLGERAALEDDITTAPRRADRGMVAGTMTVESRFVEGPAPSSGGVNLPAGAEDFELPEGGVVLGTDTVRYEMDLASSRAALLRAQDDEPYVLMDDLVLFGRRHGVPEDDARPWVRLDLEDLDVGGGEIDPFAEQSVQAIAAVHPALITDLVAGSLTGSIETRDRVEISGVETTHYSVNISIDKALGDKRRSRYPEERREAIDELIEVLGVEGNLHAADVWIDDDGLLRRFSVSLTQRPATRIEFALAVTVDYETYGGEYARELPTPEEVLSVDTVIRFIGVVGADGDGDGEAEATSPEAEPEAEAEAETPATAPVEETPVEAP